MDATSSQPIFKPNLAPEEQREPAQSILANTSQTPKLAICHQVNNGETLV
jgi:hypothetical protein